MAKASTLFQNTQPKSAIISVTGWKPEADFDQSGLLKLISANDYIDD
jgi:hypothetical protein